jgi:hypothetical protein
MMAFPEQQIAWALANRARIFRYYFIPQFLAAALFLSFAYATGKVHARLLFTGVHTQGRIVALKPVRFRSRSNTGTSHGSTIYEPTVEFALNDRVLRFQEWKGSESNAGLGWSVPVIYDASDPSFAMLDRGFSNWLPWAPCFAIGLLVGLAAIKGLLVFLFRRAPDPELPPVR